MSWIIKLVIIIAIIYGLFWAVDHGGIIKVKNFYWEVTGQDEKKTVIPDYSGCTGGRVCKPVIYLYPKTKTDINVKLAYDGKIYESIPPYDISIQGWVVTAEPTGDLINKSDGKRYQSLFWEGLPSTKTNYDLSKGFVISGLDTEPFLKASLQKLGLNDKESAEFIDFWMPMMKSNKYNLIHFAGDEYTQHAKLDITPQPDSLIRVFMVFKPLDAPISIKSQNLISPQRNGYTVVEWGGTEQN